MKVSDYIVEYIVSQGIHDIFGYQGTMIAHLVDSIGKHKILQNHSCYNEQGAAFAAVGYAKVSGKTGVAYATSGPGAMNLMSGIADAYFDSTPTVFITGQINVNEYTEIPTLRQQGFQQIDVISTVNRFTKYCVQVTKKEDIRYALEKAFFICQDKRKGPVVLDIPMNIQREEIEPQELISFFEEEKLIDEKQYLEVALNIVQTLKKAKRPIFLLGNGILKGSYGHDLILKLIHKLQIPVVTSLPAHHLLNSDDSLNFGYLGAAYGVRYANIITNKKCDLILSFACSMCRRQTSGNTENFAKQAKIIRIDIDSEELKRKVHVQEESYCMDYQKLAKYLLDLVDFQVDTNWLKVCDRIREKTKNFDAIASYQDAQQYMKTISKSCDISNIFVDVGQHLLWASQAYFVNNENRILYSGGHGAMGFSLPAAIGGYYVDRKLEVVLCGDGSFQMNIQELQWIFREQLPIWIFIFNNNSLGLIRQQQNDFFNSFHCGATKNEGYTTPSFYNIARAYGIDAVEIYNIKELENALVSKDKNKPCLFEIFIDENSIAFPKTYFGEEMDNQRPYLSKEVLDELLKM